MHCILSPSSLPYPAWTPCHAWRWPGQAAPGIRHVFVAPGLPRFSAVAAALCCVRVGTRLISMCVMLFGVVLQVWCAECCVSLVEPTVRLSPCLIDRVWWDQRADVSAAAFSAQRCAYRCAAAEVQAGYVFACQCCWSPLCRCCTLQLLPTLACLKHIRTAFRHASGVAVRWSLFACAFLPSRSLHPCQCEHGSM